MNSMIDLLTTNFYVIMVGHMEILKHDFRELTNILAAKNCKYVETKFSKSNTDDECLKSEDGMIMDLTNFHNIRRRISYTYLESIGLRDENSVEKMLNNRIIQCTLRYEAILK